MSRRLTAFATAALLLLSGNTVAADAVPSAAALAAGRAVALEFVPENAAAALVYYPQRIASSAAFKGVDQKNIPDFEEWGITLEDIEQIHMFFPAPIPGKLHKSEPKPILRFREGFDAAAFVKKVVESERVGDNVIKEGVQAGVTYHYAERKSTQPGIGYIPNVYFLIDKRTVLITQFDRIEEVKGTRKNSQALIDLIKASKTDGAARGYVVMEQFQAISAQAAEAAKAQDNDALKKLAALPEQIKHITGVIDLDSETLAEINVEAVSDMAASEVKQQADDGLAMLKGLYTFVGRGEVKRGLPKDAEPLLAMLDEAVASLAVKASDTTVQITVGRPKDFSTIGEKVLGPLLALEKQRMEKPRPKKVDSPR